jgi:glycosyltransferase involved in cell wall biosynthesis
MKSADAEILISLHSLFHSDNSPVDGTGSQLMQLLLHNNKKFIVFRSPIFGNQHMLYEYCHARICEKYVYPYKTSPSLLSKSIAEYCELLKIVRQNHSIKVFFGIDPLNALYGYIIKKILFRNYKIVFYTADYAKNRFSNWIINTLYHAIDRFMGNHADQVWNVSTRIYDVRKQQGVLDEKNYFVPNAPVFIPNSITHKKNGLLVIGTSFKLLNFTLMIDGITRLREHGAPFRLHIVGTFDFPEDMYKKITYLEKQGTVVLHGYVPHESLPQIVEQCAVGLALYTSNEPWTYYGDSMKTREYLSWGLPVIATDTTSTSEDIRNNNCGKIIKPTVEEFVSAVSGLTRVQDYKKFQKNAIMTAKKYSYDVMVKKPLLHLGI